MSNKKRYFKLWINGFLRMLGTWEEVIKCLEKGDIPEEPLHVTISSHMMTEAEYLEQRNL